MTQRIEGPHLVHSERRGLQPCDGLVQSGVRLLRQVLLSSVGNVNNVLRDNHFIIGGAAVAHWIRLYLPSCHPRFESQAHHLCFYHLWYLCYICHVKSTKINKKRPGLAHLKKINVHRIKPKGTWIFLWQYSAFGDIAAAVLIRFKNSLHFILRHCSKTIWLKFFNK